MYELDGTLFTDWERGVEIGCLDGLQLMAPTVPSKIVCVGRDYPAHAAECSAEVSAKPLLFFKPPSSVIGPDAPIVLPPQSERVEHERGRSGGGDREQRRAAEPGRKLISESDERMHGHRLLDT